MLLPEIEMEPYEHIERKSEHEGVKEKPKNRSQNQSAFARLVRK